MAAHRVSPLYGYSGATSGTGLFALFRRNLDDNFRIRLLLRLSLFRGYLDDRPFSTFGSNLGIRLAFRCNLHDYFGGYFRPNLRPDFRFDLGADFGPNLGFDLRPDLGLDLGA